jgi:hypothetical protein
MEIKTPFRAICLNDKDRPDGIPTSKWVKRGQEYTVIQVTKMRVQGGMLGFKLEELNIDDCFPYQFFAAHRFGIVVTDDMMLEMQLEKLLEEAKKEAAEQLQPA